MRRRRSVRALGFPGGYQTKITTAMMKAAAPAPVSEKTNQDSCSGVMGLSAMVSLPGESGDVGGDVGHRLLVGHGHRHRPHLRAHRVAGGRAADSRLELLHLRHEVPVG